ncbi:hypothetical protein T492DRAFT_994360, partial [Pavlovales sp. CCMP2436]
MAAQLLVLLALAFARPPGGGVGPAAYRAARSALASSARAPALRARHARTPVAATMSELLSDYSSEIDNVPLWVSERPLLPGFQERASAELCNWWYSHDAPMQVARVAVNSSIGTLLSVYSVPDDLGNDELAVVMQARMRIKARPGEDEVTQHVDLAVHALSSLPGAGNWLLRPDAENVVRSVAHAAAATTARAWAPYECSSRIGSFKFGVTELVRINRTVNSLETAKLAHTLARQAAEQASRLAGMRYGRSTDTPANWGADGPAPGRCEAEWDLWLSIDSVWFLLSKLSSKRSLLIPDEVLQLQPPPPPGGWAHQYCMQQSPEAVSVLTANFDEAYPLLRRAQRLSFVASSLMPGAPQQQILALDSVAERLRYLLSVFERHEMALRSLVALQEIEADGNLGPMDDEPPTA